MSKRVYTFICLYIICIVVSIILMHNIYNTYGTTTLYTTTRVVDPIALTDNMKYKAANPCAILAYWFGVVVTNVRSMLVSIITICILYALYKITNVYNETCMYKDSFIAPQINNTIYR